MVLKLGQTMSKHYRVRRHALACLRLPDSQQTILGECGEKILVGVVGQANDILLMDLEKMIYLKILHEILSKSLNKLFNDTFKTNKK